MSSKYITNARRPGKDARHHIVLLRNLLMEEIDDYTATLGSPGAPVTPGEVHRDLKRRIENVIDYVMNPTE
ncbi:TPA: hypothetical protein IRQ32_002409 [Escherichia coli]|nr:hypothetical protein [Escherichia coli]